MIWYWPLLIVSYKRPIIPWWILVQLDYTKSYILLLHQFLILLLSPNLVAHPNKHIINNSNLWHNRLGHPLMILYFTSIKFFPCNICLNPMIPVIFVFMLNKKDYLFLIVLLNLLNVLVLSIWIFGGPIYTTPFYDIYTL